MPTTKKPASSTKRTSKQPAASKRTKGGVAFKRPFEKLRIRLHAFLNRRPHRSFRRTRRRDYVRSLKLPGYWALTNQVRRMLWRNKKLFIILAVLYAVLTGLLVGLGSQASYAQLADLLHSSSGDILQGGWGQIGQAALLLTATVSTGLNANLTDVQKVYSVVVVLMVWLTTVWLLRSLMAGRRPRLRDGLYNAGAPIISTFLVGLVLILQLLPLAIGAIGVTALIPTGLLDGGAITMMISVVAALLAVLSLYWITSTVLALVVVTLPGMYPLQAIKTAGDLVIGRRIRVLFRLLWLLLLIVLAWVITMVPLVLLDGWLKDMFPVIEAVPIVPLGLLLMSSLTVVWSASYVYVFYRKVVEDDAAPA